MSRTTRRVNRAIQVTPPADRDRYAREWRSDLTSAAGLGISPVEVARGALRVAWRLRARHWGRTLAGAEGGGRATAVWASLVVSLACLTLISWPLSVLVLAAVMALPVLAYPRLSRVGSMVMLGTAALWLTCTAVFWWLWGVGFEAADALQPPPAVMRWYGPSFWVGLGAFVTFWIAFVVTAVRSSLDRTRARENDRA